MTFRIKSDTENHNLRIDQSTDVCKVDECDNPIRVKKLGLCTKHETRFRRYGDITKIHLPEKKINPIQIPNGPLIQNRHTIEKLTLVINTITPKIQYGYIKNEKSLKKEIANIIDDFRNNQKFGVLTERYYNYIEKICASPLAFKHGLIPINNISILYNLVRNIPNTGKISFYKMIECIIKGIIKDKLESKLGENTGSIIYKLYEENSLSMHNAWEFKIQQDEFDKSQQIVEQVDRDIIIDEVRKILKVIRNSIGYNEVFLWHKESQKTIEEKVKNYILENDSISDNELIELGIHNGRFDPYFVQNENNESDYGLVPELIEFIIQNGSTGIHNIPTQINDQKIENVNQIIADSDGLLYVHKGKVVFQLTDEYREILSLAEKLDKNNKMNEDEILEKLGFDVYGDNISKRECITNILLRMMKNEQTCKVVLHNKFKQKINQ